MTNKRELSRLKRHKTIRLRIQGTQERPRLVIRRSLKNFSACLVDDIQNKTLFSLSTIDKTIKEKFSSTGNIKASEYLGEIFAKQAKEKGFSRIVFDRAGYLYHGRVKAFAENLRKGGMEF
ncbi:MAG: 50S ribosomal protein L18 [Candidatus Omnitrophica bacterium]|nr:50S ribosomal protein L18 [Candidatus Omnitrophota bacterium]